MTPWNPPPPVPRNRPFHVVSGSHTSILMAESEVGVSVAVTRQNGGSWVKVCGGLDPGTTNVPLVLSAAEVMVACSRLRDSRLVHGVASAGVEAMATEAKAPAAAPMRHGRSMVNPP